MSRTISTWKARLIRSGILAAVSDWCNGARTDLARIHPTTVAAYGRTLARLRWDQYRMEEAARAALIQRIKASQAAAAHLHYNTEFARIMRANGMEDA